MIPSVPTETESEKRTLNSLFLTWGRQVVWLSCSYAHNNPSDYKTFGMENNADTVPH